MSEYAVYQHTYKNPHASMPLVVPLIVTCNTSADTISNNIRANSAREGLRWLCDVPAHDGAAVLCGGGPSLADHVDTIRDLKAAGATVFAINGASRYLSDRGVVVDYQVIMDAKPATATLVDNAACCHLIASQVAPDTLDAAHNPTLWHYGPTEIEGLFPPERIARGGYALFHGGPTCGIATMAVVYGMGYRTKHFFGYDSSSRGVDTHAYRQPMNDGIPPIATVWGGKAYESQVTLKPQAEQFQMCARHLEGLGCTINVYGDGLLQAMWNTPPENLSEREKYVLMWQMAGYREHSPGADSVPTFLEVANPEGRIIDFGCGTGKASLLLKELGHNVLLVDFAENCRDAETRGLPFIQCDLTQPMPVSGDVGFCSDVMEHIPPEDVDATLMSIMRSVPKSFFKISTVPDKFGAVIQHDLHLTVRPHEWWVQTFERLGFRVTWSKPGEISTQILVERH